MLKGECLISARELALYEFRQSVHYIMYCSFLSDHVGTVTIQFDASRLLVCVMAWLWKRFCMPEQLGMTLFANTQKSIRPAYLLLHKPTVTLIHFEVVHMMASDCKSQDILDCPFDQKQHRYFVQKDVMVWSPVHHLCSNWSCTATYSTQIFYSTQGLALLKVNITNAANEWETHVTICTAADVWQTGPLYKAQTDILSN